MAREEREGIRARRDLRKREKISFEERVRRLEAMGLAGLTQFVIETEDNLRRRDNLVQA